ncbi:MAG: hypothetical protein DI564_16105 [Rhodanobacter denitrificans]|uniref:Diguanylate cyclase n=1 Tax=Rhodanobacter denitrificans TaxID=666685 RepID=A0A2W5K609_9GAMM|nr:MAG: hypothetical protein DI564_16105 [Rhodanobacter denitrificans]
MSAAGAVLLGVILPAWLLAGAADYLLHRRVAIEHNAGWRESLLHVAEWAQVALPAWAALWLELNYAILLLVVAGAVAHQATAWWDTRHAQRHRLISATEQQVHGFMNVLPLIAAALAFGEAWFGNGTWQPDWTLRTKAEPLPMSIAILATAAIALALLPILEETWRGLRRARCHGVAVG